MKKLSIVLAILAVAAIVFGVVMFNQKGDLQNQVTALTGEKDGLQKQVTSLTNDLNAAKEEVTKAAASGEEALNATIADLTAQLESAKDDAAKAVEEAKAAAQEKIDSLTSELETVKTQAADAAKAAEEALAQAKDDAAKAVEEAVAKAKQEAEEAAAAAKETVNETVEKATETVEETKEAVKEAVEGAVEGVEETAAKAEEAVKETTEEATEKVEEAAKDAAATVENTLNAAAAAVTGEVSKEGRKTVTIWHTFTRDQKDTLEKLAAEFNASQETYFVEVENFPSSDFDSKVRTAVINGDGPDIIFHYSSEAANYINADDPSQNLVADLGKYLNDPEIGIENWASCMDKVLIDETCGYVDGLTHSIPVVRTGPIYFYNKTIFDELKLNVPTTWTELAEVAKAIAEGKSGDTHVYGYAADSLTDMIQSIIMQKGSEYIDQAAKEAKLDNQVTVDAITWYGENVKNGYFMAQPTTAYYSDDMNSQIVASYIGSCAGIPYLFPQENGWELGLAPIPQEGDVKWYPAWNRSAIVFSSDEETEKGAYLFVKFFIQPENNLRWCQSMIALSPFYATQELDGYKALVEANPALQAVQECLPDAGFLPTIAGASVVRSELTSLAQQAGDANNTTPVADMVKESVQTMNDALQGN